MSEAEKEQGSMTVAGPDHVDSSTAMCPSCGTDWRDGDSSRLIGVYDWARDRTVEWMCPDCQSRWDR